MNYVYCSDLKNYQVIGTFLELLYHLKVNKNEELTPVVIVGDRDADKIPALKDLLFTKLGIKNGIYQVNNNIELDCAIEETTESLIEKITSIHELRDLEYNGTNIGTGIASSITSKHRCIEPDLKKYNSELKAYTQQCILFLESFKKIAVDHLNVSDTIYIYNGRLYNNHPQSLVCEKIGFNIFYYERMNNGQNLKIQKTRIHDFAANSLIVKNFWQDSTDVNKEKIGELFFEKNKHNKFTQNFSNEFETDRKIVSFFTSSEDEYASLDKRICISDIFDCQRTAFEWLANWAASQSQYTLVVRLHPNQGHICPKDYFYWHNYAGKNIKIIPSHSNIDSYDLVRRSSKVISFLSTIGIEATRLGVPSIILGNPMYKGFDAVYEPKSIDQLKGLLENKIKSKNIKNTIPYGYYNLKFGFNFDFFPQTGLDSFLNYPKLLEKTS